MSFTPNPIQDFRCRVVSNQECGNNLKRLRLQSLSSDFACLPGQFVMLDLPETQFYFRRPFSVIDTPSADTLEIYYKRVGTGTQLMWELEPEALLTCLGPLGNSFTLPKSPKTALYIGGGIGIAPPYLMAKRQPETGHCFYGVRSHAEIGLEAELKAVFSDRLHIATDDGSSGFSGNVCQLLEKRQDLVLAAQEAYVCGPTRMMEAVATLLRQINPHIRVEVSLEERMPCGTGACTGCVTPRTDQYLPSKVCVEGPVFNAESIRWQGDLLPLSQFCEEAACPL